MCHCPFCSSRGGTSPERAGRPGLQAGSGWSDSGSRGVVRLHSGQGGVFRPHSALGTVRADCGSELVQISARPRSFPGDLGPARLSPPHLFHRLCCEDNRRGRMEPCAPHPELLGGRAASKHGKYMKIFFLKTLRNISATGKCCPSLPPPLKAVRATPSFSACKGSHETCVDRFRPALWTDIL